VIGNRLSLDYKKHQNHPFPLLGKEGKSNPHL